MERTHTHAHTLTQLHSKLREYTPAQYRGRADFSGVNTQKMIEQTLTKTGSWLDDAKR